jgi:hypothetical protein
MGGESKSGSTNTSTDTSGEGSRPATSAGVDNLGAADGFTPGKAKADGFNTPSPSEKMQDKRQDDSVDTAARPGPRSGN